MTHLWKISQILNISLKYIQQQVLPNLCLIIGLIGYSSSLSCGWNHLKAQSLPNAVRIGPWGLKGRAACLIERLSFPIIEHILKRSRGCFRFALTFKIYGIFHQCVETSKQNILMFDLKTIWRCFWHKKLLKMLNRFFNKASHFCNFQNCAKNIHC